MSKAAVLLLSLFILSGTAVQAQKTTTTGSNNAIHVKSTNTFVSKKPYIVVKTAKGEEAITEKQMHALDPGQIESIHVFKGESAVEMFGEKAKEGAIVIELKLDAALPPVGDLSSKFTPKNATDLPVGSIKIRSSKNLSVAGQPLFIIKTSTGDIAVKQEKMNEINPDWIKSIDVLKGSKATDLYDANGKNGVVLISIKTEHEAEVEQLLKKAK